MSLFKKKNVLGGNQFDLEDDDVQKNLLPSCEDLDSNMFSEMDEDDMKILEL